MKGRTAFVLGLLLSGGLLLRGESDAPVVKTADGVVSGIVDANSHIASFKSIPFAAPPVGNLRWRAPMPVKPWHGVLKADDFGSSCMQKEPKEMLPWTVEYLTENKVSEDCLFLNVWTPKVSAKAKLPVIVYIYGGGFTSGSGAVSLYDGRPLAAKGVVFVSINYRVGVFGFFAHPELAAESEHHSSGNYGLLDQIAGLEWVKKNIAAFGGDPGNVTIWGQSAGAFSVGILVASPLGKGLFEHAMGDSGLGVSGVPMPTLQEAESEGVKYASALGAKSIQDLRAIPPEKLLEGPMYRALPDIDGWLLPDTPKALSRRGVDNDVPIITGYQANDGLLFIHPIHSVEDYKLAAQHAYGDMAADFEKLYPATGVDDARAMTMRSIRDRDRVSMYLWATARIGNHRQPVFTYFFDRGVPWPQHPEYGAFHSGELPYFFMNLKLMERPWEPVDFSISKTTGQYVENFAEKGDPNGEGVPVWPQAQADHRVTMELGEKMGPMPVADKARFDFWVKYFQSDESKDAPPF